MTTTTDHAINPPHTTGGPAAVDSLLTPSEVAALFRVDPKTVTRWAKAGRVDCIRTLGGHRRYPATQFAHLLDRPPATATAATGTAVQASC
jgi:excisionase family DNA binding protein